jgi:FKBP-type peptidyl-prolyl cis-trans isomerase FklB
MQYSKLLLLPALFLSPCAFAAEVGPKSEVEKLSYSLGVKTGENLRGQDIAIDTKQFARGLTDGVTNKKTLLTDKEMQETITKFQNQQIAKFEDASKKVASVNLLKSNQFMQENKSKPGVKTLSSGLQYTVMKDGKGKPPKSGDIVTVNYRGTLIDGTEFDSSYSRNESSTFPLENLIPAWQEALVLMSPGSKWKIYVPPSLGYGEQGAGRVIEPNSALIFEIELISFKPKA